MVPKPAATGARQHHPPAIATGGEFTSLPVYQVFIWKFEGHHVKSAIVMEGERVKLGLNRDELFGVCQHVVS